MPDAATNRIDALAALARDGQLDVGEAVRQISALAEGHDRAARGAHFTASDVALSLARAAIGAQVVEAACSRFVADEAVSRREDPCVTLGMALNSDMGRAVAARKRLTELAVLDPTCGAGAFLLAAWQILIEIEHVIDLYAPPEAGAARVGAHQLHGVDVDGVAAHACRVVLGLVAGPGAHISAGDATAAGALPRVDVVIGNPPFVRKRVDDLPADLASRRAGNLAAAVCERALRAIRPGGHMALVMPISVASAGTYRGLREVLDDACAHVWACHFDAIPQALFPDAVQRITLLHARRQHVHENGDPCRWHTSRYYRWLAAEREQLLDQVRYVALPANVDVHDALPKLASPAEVGAHQQMERFAPAGRYWVGKTRVAKAGNSGLSRHIAKTEGVAKTGNTRQGVENGLISENAPVSEKGNQPQKGNNGFFYKRRWSYHLLLVDRPPPILRDDGSTMPSELNRIDVVEGVDAKALLAIYASTLFAWHFTVMSDCRNLNRRELERFPLPDLGEGAQKRLSALSDELMAALWASSHQRTCRYRDGSKVINTYFAQGQTMDVIDRIDIEVAALYGLSEAQAGAISAFDRRFRAPHD